MDMIFKLTIDYWIIFLILFNYYFIAMPYILASIRQKLFAMRTGWFCFTAQGHIEFSDPLYQELRDMINTFIRIQKSYTIVTFIFVLWSQQARGASQELEGLWKKIEKCNDVQKQKIAQLFYGIGKMTLLTLFVNSPILSTIFMVLFLLLFVPVMLLIMQRKLWQWLKEEYKEKTLSIIHSKIAV